MIIVFRKALSVLAQSTVLNRLLSSLSPSDFALLAPHLEPLDLPVNKVVVGANKPIDHAYFLESGIVSVVASRADSQSIEVGIYGREGMGGFPLLLGSDQSPHDQYIQLAGAGHRIKSAAFLRAVQRATPSIGFCCASFTCLRRRLRRRRWPTVALTSMSVSRAGC